VDTRRWVLDEDFADYCHMDNSGVSTFSQRLGQEVVQPMVEGKPIRAAVLLADEEPKTP